MGPVNKKELSKVVRLKSGQLKIEDSWNAITIIALSQNNPLKAIAEFVENSINDKAKTIRIVRGRKKGKRFLKNWDNRGRQGKERGHEQKLTGNNQ